MPTKKKTPERYVDILKISKRYLVLLGIAELSTGPFQEAVTPKNIIAGLNATEIFPFNRFAIDPSRFLPSFLTDRPGILVLYNSFYQNVLIFTVSTNRSRRSQ